ncbi:MAG: amidohydrolase family protein [Candidatus Zipacnadales bacterium]
MPEVPGALPQVGTDRRRLVDVEAVHLASAEAVAVSSTRIIGDGAIAWRGTQIVAVGPREELRDIYSDADETHYEGLAIFPSFINAHTHLCLSFLEGKTPYDGDFAAWLQSVLHAFLEWTEEDHANSLNFGLRQAIETGTAAVGDILNDWRARSTYRGAPIGGTAFLQVTGFNPVVAEVWLHNLRQVFDAVPPKAELGNISLGISPHAPYSTGIELYRGCFELAEKYDLLLMTHLAETREEEYFLRTGQGIYRRMLRDRGTWVARWQPPNMTPVEYMESHGLLSNRCLYGHVNYPSDSDLELLVARDANVVYCPKSHAYFGHAPHRMDEMIERGIRVALGTDGLSSNDSLAMLEEVKLVRRRFPNLSAEAVFDAGTIRGAEALRVTADYGTLEPGRKASFVIVDLQKPLDIEHLFEQLLAPESKIVGVVAWGQTIR